MIHFARISLFLSQLCTLIQSLIFVRCFLPHLWLILFKILFQQYESSRTIIFCTVQFACFTSMLFARRNNSIWRQLHVQVGSTWKYILWWRWLHNTSNCLHTGRMSKGVWVWPSLCRCRLEVEWSHMWFMHRTKSRSRASFQMGSLWIGQPLQHHTGSVFLIVTSSLV